MASRTGVVGSLVAPSATGDLSQRLAVRVAQGIEALIAELHLSTGARLPGERSLCTRFGVSRSMLREAVRLLEHKGIVEVIPARGIFVASNGMEMAIQAVSDRLREEELDFSEFVEARRLLEVRIAALAAERRTEENLATLHALTAAMREGLEAPDQFYQADLDFHREVALASRNRLFSLWLQPILGNLVENIRTQVLLREIRHRILAGHEHILEAVEAADPAAAAAAMAAHIDQFADNTRQIEEMKIF